MRLGTWLASPLHTGFRVEAFPDWHLTVSLALGATGFLAPAPPVSRLNFPREPRPTPASTSPQSAGFESQLGHFRPCSLLIPLGDSRWWLRAGDRLLWAFGE